MNELKALADSDLIQATKTSVGDEARVTARVIACLEEIDARRLHLEMGYPSLFEFATRELGYSEPSAYRRINAMRVVREVPAIRSQVEDGSLPLTTLTQVQRFFNHENKVQGKRYSREQKQELIQELVGKSTRQCERTLAALSPEAIQVERVRAVSEFQTQITFTANAELMADLEKIRQLWGHQGDLNYAELFEKMAKQVLVKIDPEKRVVRDKAAMPVAAPKVGEDKTPRARARHIPNPLRRSVWKRDQGRCTFTNPQTGRRCGSRFALQLDHRNPFALGGGHTAKNLRLLCRAHNLHHAVKTFGAERMAASMSMRR